MGEGEGGKLSKERSGSIDGGKSSGRKSLDGQDSLSTNNSQEKTSNNTVEEYEVNSGDNEDHMKKIPI